MMFTEQQIEKIAAKVTRSAVQYRMNPDNGVDPLDFFSSEFTRHFLNAINEHTALPSSNCRAEPGVVTALINQRDKDSMIDAVKQMQDYWGTYHKQNGYEGYRTGTLIDDALYGIGIAIDPNRFVYTDGYDRFKAVLREYLDR